MAVGFVLFGCLAVNADECLMTRLQEMSLDYHFTVEQEVGSSIYAFFGFNGTYMHNIIIRVRLFWNCFKVEYFFINTITFIMNFLLFIILLVWM